MRKIRNLTWIPVWLILVISGCSHSLPSGQRISVGGIVVTCPVKSAQEIKWTNVNHQSLDISCGPAALSTLLNYYLGDQVTEFDIISNILESSDLNKIKKIQKRQAFSMLDLKRFALYRGYQAAGYKVGIRDLIEFGKPLIIPIESLGYKHFVVFKGIKGDRVYLADPSFGNITMRYPHFLYAWKQKVGLVVSKKDGKEIKNHGLSLDNFDGVYVDGSIHRVVNSGVNGFIPFGDF